LRLEVLGSGGAVATPQPGCACRVCQEARKKGVPYSRTGPSLFVHDVALLIDTPEESRQQLVRAGVDEVRTCLYSHWHPDHVMGRRVFEGMNYDFRGWPRSAKHSKRTRVLLPERVARDFRTYLGSWDHLRFLEQRLGVVQLEVIPEGASTDVENLSVTPIALAEDYVYAFLLELGGRRVLVAMDELHGWRPPELGPLDLAYLPQGLAEHDPLTGERRIAAEHPLLQAEATFPQTLEIVRALSAKRVVLSHVEEMDGLTHDDLSAVADKVRAEEGLEIEFAYDTMAIEV
jgi:phosphoribosyl 1,2-cyclic phosphate phosphodiesterase